MLSSRGANFLHQSATVTCDTLILYSILKISAIVRDEFFPMKDMVSAVKIRKTEWRIRLKLCLPTNSDIDGGSLTVGFGVKNE